LYQFCHIPKQCEVYNSIKIEEIFFVSREEEWNKNVSGDVHGMGNYEYRFRVINRVLGREKRAEPLQEQKNTTIIGFGKRRWWCGLEFLCKIWVWMCLLLSPAVYSTSVEWSTSLVNSCFGLLHFNVVFQFPLLTNREKQPT